jgi:hypothetical protein
MLLVNQASHGRVFPHWQYAIPSVERGVMDGRLQVYDFSPVITILQYFSRFFTPFLSCKRLVSRRLWKNQGLIESWQCEIEKRGVRDRPSND